MLENDSGDGPRSENLLHTIGEERAMSRVDFRPVSQMTDLREFFLKFFPLRAILVHSSYTECLCKIHPDYIIVNVVGCKAYCIEKFLIMLKN